MSDFDFYGAFTSTAGRSFEIGSQNLNLLNSAITRITDKPHEVTSIIGGKQVRGTTTSNLSAPHDHSLELGTIFHADDAAVELAINTAIETSKTWGSTPWKERAQPFLRAANLLENGDWGIRLVAATMVELSKTSGQAYGDAVCETVDLIKMNLLNFARLNAVQPLSSPGIENHLDYRPLEGFVFAVSPFNFTSMSHLAITPALLGNTVVWKAAEDTSLVAYLTMQLLSEAGLPDGVINLLVGKGSSIGPKVLNHPSLAGVSFTGSTGTFNGILESTGANTRNYVNYPRIVGETGGKGYVFAHPSADVHALAQACIKGAFEYQGQKCSAAARAYIPESLWPELQAELKEQTTSLSVGDPTDSSVFMGAVINQKQFAYHQEVIEHAKQNATIVVGGETDSSKGWFIYPTIIETHDPLSEFMTDEFFGPILSVFVYPDSDWQSVLELIDTSTVFGLAGSIFSTDTASIDIALGALRYSAGNITINDKPTGASVGYQPFGGARASGTNDKVGTTAHLTRFLSPLTIKYVS